MANHRIKFTAQRTPNQITLLSIALFVVLLLSGTAVFSVLADAPAQGTVIEGVSVPGIELGFTRAQVETAYGQPTRCQNVEVSNDLAFCRFPVEGSGSVSVWYQGADGRYANNSPDDIIYKIGWFASGWTTTAGVNLELALQDRQAVAAAYPNAKITYDDFGNINSVEDSQLGIVIKWIQNFYMFPDSVSMAIYTPPAILPDGSSIHISDIHLEAEKVNGQRHILSVISVQGEGGEPVYGATVTISWIYPNGAVATNTDETSNTGYIFFELYPSRNGVYTLTVNNALLEGHPFDRENSLLSASIRIR